MKLLAIEFSSPRRSVAVAVDGVVRGAAAEQGGRDTHAFALIDSALKTAGVAREEIECVAVGIGPGSYAGIRISVAIAQGWHLARQVKLLAVPSADAVAASFHESGGRGVLHTLVDAQRGELFEAQYFVDDSGWRLAAPFVLCSPATGRPSAGHSFVRCDVLEHVSERVALPEAEWIARLAAVRSDYVAASALEPIYMRKAEFVKVAQQKRPSP